MNFIHSTRYSLDSTYTLHSVLLPQITVPDPKGTDEMVHLLNEPTMKKEFAKQLSNVIDQNDANFEVRKVLHLSSFYQLKNIQNYLYRTARKKHRIARGSCTYHK